VNGLNSEGMFGYKLRRHHKDYTILKRMPELS